MIEVIHVTRYNWLPTPPRPLVCGKVIRGAGNLSTHMKVRCDVVWRRVAVLKICKQAIVTPKLDYGKVIRECAAT